MKRKPMPPALMLQEPDPKVLNQLMDDLRGPSEEASKRAFTTLVTLGSPIPDVIASPEFDPHNRGLYGFGDMAAVINEAARSDSNVFAGLAKAVTGANEYVQLSAIQVCRLINPSHAVLLDALVQALGAECISVRREAGQALGEIRLSTPAVLKGLATALRDPDLSVVFEVMTALGSIGAPSPEVLEGLVHFLDNVNSPFCGTAMSALTSIGSFAPPVLGAIRRVATSTFSFDATQPVGLGDDDDYRAESYSRAERQHKWNRQQAVDLLAQIPLEVLVEDAAATATQKPVLSVEDERILGWFNEVDMTQYLVSLQVFWCIGYVEREAIESAGPALGWHKLNARLVRLNPQFTFAPLPTGVTYLREECIPSVDGLFDREPFHSNAWSDEEQGLELRKESMLKNRPQGIWTPKAQTAWGYVDRFLTLRGWLPAITVENT